jgi:N-acetylglucosamine malate deacetylase 1
MYEWLPYNGGYLEQVPAGDAERRVWLGQLREFRFQRAADLYRETLVASYGEARGRAIRYAEAFEACEYGTPLTAENRQRLFPFFG